ncbi:hypothetical protein ACFVZD_41695 [Streptomyces sp. NPDC058287]|uniref:hypothetical protein n=1 Tax=unclassified Streptomyces TaxID=2593676 RepID=UPI0036E2487F
MRALGHADPAITLRVYAHFMPEADGRGRRAMDAWFAPAAVELKKMCPYAPQRVFSLPSDASLKAMKLPLKPSGVRVARPLGAVSPVN